MHDTERSALWCDYYIVINVYRFHIFLQKFGHYKMQDAIDTSDHTSPHHTQSSSSSLPHNHHHHHHYHHTPSTMAPHTVTSATPVSQSQTVKEETRTWSTGGEKDSQAPEAEYVNSRCVVFTYFKGEINKVGLPSFTGQSICGHTHDPDRTRLDRASWSGQAKRKLY